MDKKYYLFYYIYTQDIYFGYVYNSSFIFLEFRLRIQIDF